MYMYHFMIEVFLWCKDNENIYYVQISVIYLIFVGRNVGI